MQKEIDAGKEIPGIAGAVWRLIDRCDYREVEYWISSEMVRGTPQLTMFDVIAAAAAAMVLQMAGRMNRNQVRPAARDIMQKAVELLESDIEVLQKAKKEDTILRNSLRVVSNELK